MVSSGEASRDSKSNNPRRSADRRLFIQTDDLEGENSSETNPRVNIFILFVKT